MVETVKTVGLWILNIVVVGGGVWLLIWGVLGIIGGAQGTNKEWGKVFIGVVIGLIGGFAMVAGGTFFWDFFQTNGSGIPLK